MSWGVNNVYCSGMGPVDSTAVVVCVRVCVCVVRRAPSSAVTACLSCLEATFSLFRCTLL